MLAVAGETATEMEAGGVCVGGEVDFEAVPQEARAIASRDTRRNRKMVRSAEYIEGIVWNKEAGKGNWTQGQKWGRGGETSDEEKM